MVGMDGEKESTNTMLSSQITDDHHHYYTDYDIYIYIGLNHE